MFDFLWSKPPEPSIGIGTMIFYCYLAFVLIRMLGKFKGGFNIDVKRRKRKGIRKGGGVGDELDNVIGLNGVKEEIKYYMDLINNREKYSEWGVKLPKGILLAGPPGTGKTLLVKSMAEALDIPIISVAGSSFVEMYVGVGASRVRKLFKKARDVGDKCIIFIDELDAVGSKRNLDGNSERASTLNQLLVEMDGFDDDGIIVFAATNWR